MKLSAMPYYTRNGEKKTNCFRIYIPKSKLKQAGLNSDQELTIKAEKGKIIVEGVK